MVGRRRAARRAAWAAIVLAAGCGSPSLKPQTDAAEPSADTATDAEVDAPEVPADALDLCPWQRLCAVTFSDRVADCTYALPARPPDPSNVGVNFVGDAGYMHVPRDLQHQDGWDYVDATDTSIHLYGSWCDVDRSGMFGRAKIVFGCPGICIP
jgi:hypothetical protein